MLAPLFAALLIHLCAPWLGERFGGGNRDLISFWSGARLFWEGRNPYDSALLLSLQEGQGLRDEMVKITWNPPWFFLVLAPLLSASLAWATVSVFLLNISAVVFIGVVTHHLLLFNERGASTAPSLRVAFQSKMIGRGAVVAVLFVPAVHTLAYGQSSLFITALLCAMLALYFRRSDWWCGVAASLLTIKPHLLLFLAGACGVRFLFEGRWSVFFGVICGLFGQIGAVFIVNPSSLSQWWRLLFHGGAQSVGDWKTATLCSALREWLGGGGHSWLISAFIVVSLLGGALFGSGFRRGRGKSDPVVFFLTGTVLSVVLSPYGWVFDHSLLILPRIYSFFQLSRRFGARFVTVCFLFGEGILLLTTAALCQKHQHYFFLPLLAALLWGVFLSFHQALRSHEGEGGVS